MFQERLTGPCLPCCKKMKIRDYSAHIELGIDEATGQRNAIVRSASEFAALPEAQQRHAWATIAVASEILETTLQGIYYKIYRGTIPTKIVKKNATNRRGTTFVKVYQTVKHRADKREADQRRITKSLRRTLKKASWIPEAQRLLLVVLVHMKLREFERELLKDKKGKGTGEGASHGPAEAQ